MSTVARPIGDLDLHLFGEGTHRRLWELLGPQALHVDADGTASAVRFSVWAPHASEVAVVGDWNDWTPEPLAMLDSDGPTGIWSGVAPHARSGHRYRYRIVGPDGEVLDRFDPLARATEVPPSDVSVVPTCAAFGWTDDDWMSRRWRSPAGHERLSIYEVHLASWRRGIGTWTELGERLGDHLATLGFTHVQVRPIAGRAGGSGARQVSGHYAPTAGPGEPDGFRRFVDLLHRRGIGVIVEWVPGSFAAHEWSLAQFDGTPLYERAEEPPDEHAERGAFAFDLGRRQVRNFLVANALYWFDEFHVDGLCVAGVTSMLRPDDGSDGHDSDPAARAFVRDVNSVVGEEFPDVLMITQDVTGLPDATALVSAGGFGFSHAWNAPSVRRCLTHLSRRAEDRPPQEHDLGPLLEPAFGERSVLPLRPGVATLDDGSVPTATEGMDTDDAGDPWASLRLVLACQWALPGAPLVFMGTELATRCAWDGTDGADDAEPLPWALLDEPAHRGVHDLVGRLNAAAAAWPALWRRDGDPGGFERLGVDGEHRTVSFLRWDVSGDAAVVCVANLGPRRRAGHRVGLPWVGEWEVLLDTDDPRWSGRGPGAGTRRLAAAHEPWQGQGSSVVLDLASQSMVWLAARAPR